MPEVKRLEHLVGKAALIAPLVLALQNVVGCRADRDICAPDCHPNTSLGANSGNEGQEGDWSEGGDETTGGEGGTDSMSGSGEDESESDSVSGSGETDTEGNPDMGTSDSDEAGNETSESDGDEAEGGESETGEDPCPEEEVLVETEQGEICLDPDQIYCEKENPKDPDACNFTMSPGDCEIFNGNQELFAVEDGQLVSIGNFDVDPNLTLDVELEGIEYGIEGTGGSQLNLNTVTMLAKLGNNIHKIGLKVYAETEIHALKELTFGVTSYECED